MFRAACILVAAGLAVGVAVERRARGRLTDKNRALRQQLSRMDDIAAVVPWDSTTVSQVERAPARPRELLEAGAQSNTQAEELVRLHKKVDALQQQYRELETLRADTRKVREAVELRGRDASMAARAGNTADRPDFEILKADYWTANPNMDVAAELQERVRGNRLKAMASNNIKGDPDFGQVKHLTVVYRVGGVIRTNQFREGDVIILPPE